MTLSGHPRLALEAIWDALPEDSPKSLISTCFDFNPQLFEHDILPRLCGEAPGSVNTTRLNRSLKKQQVSSLVVADRSTNSGPKGNYRYGLLNVGLRKGRFHPKINLAIGGTDVSPVIYASVGSANLTYAGWSRNTEVVGWFQVQSEHAPELLAFIRWLEEKRADQLSDSESEGNVKALLLDATVKLSIIAQQEVVAEGCPRLRISLPGNDSLVSSIVGDEQWKRLTFFSPYWFGLDKWGKVFQESGVSDFRWVATISQVEPGKFVFPSMSEIGTAPVCYHPETEIKDSWLGRFCHAKILLLENDNDLRLVIGSANATGAALQHRSNTFSNVEAILIYDITNKSALAADILNMWGDEKRFKALSEDELVAINDEEGGESSPPLPPLDLFVTATLCEKDSWHYSVTWKWYNDKDIAEHQVVIGEKKLNLIKDCSGKTSLKLVAEFPYRYFTWCSDKYADLPGSIVLLGDIEDELLGYYPPVSIKQLLDELYQGKIGAHENDDTGEEDDDDENDDYDGSWSLDEGEEPEQVDVYDPFMLYRVWHQGRTIIAENVSWQEQLCKSITKDLQQTLTTKELMQNLMLTQLLFETSNKKVIEQVSALVVLCKERVIDLLVKDPAFIQSILGDVKSSMQNSLAQKKLKEKAKAYMQWWEAQHSDIWEAQ